MRFETGLNRLKPGHYCVRTAYTVCATGHVRNYGNRGWVLTRLDAGYLQQYS
jgi:hypothetical protein